MIHVDGPPVSGAVALARRLATDLHYRLELSLIHISEPTRRTPARDRAGTRAATLR